MAGRRRGDKLPPARRVDAALLLAAAALITALTPLVHELLDALL